MGIASVIAAIALGVVFMLQFLLALLREGTPSVRCWIVPVWQKSDKENLVAAGWRWQREKKKEKEKESWRVISRSLAPTARSSCFIEPCREPDFREAENRASGSSW
jgi:hypothetical protein